MAGGDPTGGRHAFDQDAALTPIFTTLRRGAWRRPRQPSSPHPQSRAPHAGMSSHGPLPGPLSGPLSGPRTLRPVPDAVAQFRNDPLTAPLPVVSADGYDHGPADSVDPYAPASFAVVAASSPDATTWWQSPLAGGGDDQPRANAPTSAPYAPAPPHAPTYDANPYDANPYDAAPYDSASYDQSSYDSAHYGQGHYDQAPYDPALRQPAAYDTAYDRAPHAPAPHAPAQYEPAQYDPAQYDPARYATVLPHPTAYAPAHHPAPSGQAHDPTPYIPSAYAPVHDDRHGPGYDGGYSGQGRGDRGYGDGYDDRGHDNGAYDNGAYDNGGYGEPVRYDIPRRGRRFADPMSYDPVTDSGRHHRLAPAGW